MEAQTLELGKVLGVHEIPSRDVAAAVLGSPETAKKTPFPKFTPYHILELGRVLAVQVIPSGDVAAAVLGPPATVTNKPLP